VTKKVLLVSDGLRPERPGRDPEKDVEAADKYLLTLGFGASLDKRASRAVDVERLAESSSRSVIEFIPPFIYEFPKKKMLPGSRSILDILRYKDINFWWFNKMPEKGALWSKLIKRLYSFDLIISQCGRQEYDEIWMDCGDIELAELLKRNQSKLPDIKAARGRGGAGKKETKSILSSAHNNLRIFISAAIKTMIVRYAGKSSRSGQKKPEVAFFSFYPLFWSRDGKKESFFANAPKRVLENEGVVYLTWFSMGAGQLFKKARDYFDPDLAPVRVPLEAYLGLRDYLSTFFSLLAYFFKASAIFLCRRRIKAYYKGFDISNIAADELLRGLSGQEAAMCLLIKRAFENYCSKNPLRAVVFRAEFQPHERALVFAAKGRCPSIAFQHQAIGRNFLQYFFPKEEITGAYEKRGDPDVQPLADKYLAAGTYPRDVLVSSGFRDEDLKIAGPVRYSGLVEYLKSAKSRIGLRKKYGYAQDQKLVLVTPPAAKGEVQNFAMALAKAAEGLKGGCAFLFKSHPVFKFNDEIERIIKEHCPGMKREYLEDSVNLNDYLTMSDCLVLSGTTVGIEAICLGTMPVLLDNPNIFSLNPLTEIKDALFLVSDHGGLRAAITSAIGDDDSCRTIKANWPRAIEKIFYNIDEDPDGRFAGILEGLTRK